MVGESLDRYLPALVILLAGALFYLVHWNSGPVVLSPERASWTLTPGAVNPDVTQDTIDSTICVTGWASSIRPDSSYTADLKLTQMREYGRTGSPSDYQEDHLVSLELGGDPTDPRNLWPEPISRAEEVDHAENDLNSAICSGRMTLAAAQRKISEIKHVAG